MDITRILVPYDFSDPSQRALSCAKWLAERFDAALDVLHVVPDPYVSGLYFPMAPGFAGPALPPGFADDCAKEARKRLEDAFPEAERKGHGVTVEVKMGEPRAEILAYAAARRTDLIVMGTHGRGGVAHLFLGSVAERLVRTAPCPVLTLR